MPTTHSQRLVDALSDLTSRFAGLDDLLDAVRRESEGAGLPPDTAASYHDLLVAAEITRRWGARAARMFAEGAAVASGREDDPALDKAVEAGVALGRRSRGWAETVELARRDIDSPPRAETLPDKPEGPAPDLFAEAGVADPLDRDPRDWGPDDAAAVMMHKDYGRETSATGPARHAKVARYFDLHGDDPGNPVIEALGRRGQPESARNRKPVGPLEKFRDDLMALDDPTDDIALKPVHDWTEDEARRVMHRRLRLSSQDPRKAELERKEGDWYRQVYGDGPAAFDEFGRMREPRPIRPIPREPSPVQGADGRPLADGLRRLGRKVVAGAGKEGAELPAAVRSLQAGINLIESLKAKGDDRPRVLDGIAEDGIVGPRTRGALRRAIALHGPTGVEEGMALARFRDMTRNSASLDEAGLEEAAGCCLGPLLRAEGKGGARLEVEALQRALNGLGGELLGDGEWEYLPETGRVDGATLQAFRLVSAKVAPDRLVRELAAELGIVA
jgi:hypothetical protein